MWFLLILITFILSTFIFNTVVLIYYDIDSGFPAKYKYANYMFYYKAHNCAYLISFVSFLNPIMKYTYILNYNSDFCVIFVLP